MDEKTFDVDAIVVGSGFGGAVSAARLAQAGLSTVVLERGRRWRPGQFPRGGVLDELLWHERRGLYDVRWMDTMVGVAAAGWGGGSLVYANVFSRPPADVFGQAPGNLTRADLDPYYDLAAHMLGVSPVAADPATGRVPERTRALEDAVARLDRPAGTVRPLLAVTFAGGAAGRPGCTFCAECVLGCNVGAKNSLDHTYLDVAERHGARALTECEARRIERVPGGYRITYADLADGGFRSLTAPRVFLGAGALGTTELLLRARDVDKTLPDLSPRLGEGFSGNGDFLAFLDGLDPAVRTDQGPTITTTTVVDCSIDGRDVWFQVQDGAYPPELADLVRSAIPSLAPARRRKAAPSRGRRLALLLMGRDTSDGTLTLDAKEEIRVDWHNRPNAALYRAQVRAVREVARRLGGRARLSPMWSLLRVGVTVHNLGGARVGDVVDARGEVPGYPDLYVVDGAALPSSTGVNPSATIAALAERTVEHAIRRALGDPAWTAPERAAVRPGPVPEDDAARAVRTWRASRRGYGAPAIHFAETMRGSLMSRGGQASAPAAPVELRLDVELPGAPVVGRTGVATVRGTLATAGRRHPVRGTLELFPDAHGAYMRYTLVPEATPPAGTPAWEVTGVKRITSRPVPSLRDLTTLALAGTGPDGDPLDGTIHIGPAALLKLGLSLRARDDRPTAVVRFAAWFARSAVRRASGRH